MKLSVIIPAYNEAATLAEVVRRVARVDLPGSMEKELILVDDGSTDGTGDICDECAEEFGAIAVRSVINLGKGAAVRLGFAYASGDIVLVQDADLELDPEQYPDLVGPILDGRAEVVYGSRFLQGGKGGSLLSRLANQFLVWCTNILYGARLTDMETAYKAIRRDILGAIRLRSARFEFEPEITCVLLRLGYRICEVPIRYHPRTVGEGKKIGAWDGFMALATLVRYRFMKADAFRA